MKKNIYFIIFCIVLLSCSGLKSNKTSQKNIENSFKCLAVGDTTYLSGNIKLIRCRDDSFFYFLAIKNNSCDKFFETSYSEDRIYYVLQNFYDLGNSFVVETRCGSNMSFCFTLFNKLDYQEVVMGYMYVIDTTRQVLVYFSEDEEHLIAYFPNTNKKTTYKIANKINISEELYYMKRTIKEINDSLLIIEVEDINKTHTFYSH